MNAVLPHCTEVAAPRVEVAAPPAMKTVTAILATRGRPGLLAYTVERTLANAREPGTRIVISVDDDDLETLAARGVDPRIVWSIEPRPDSLGQKYNRGVLAAPADVYLVMVDYAPVVTEGWDTRLLAASRIYPDGYCFILNHLANVTMSQCNAVTHKLAAAMGGIYPEHFPYWFVDHWFEELARRTSRQVFCDIWIDTSRRPGTMSKKEPYLWGILFGCLAPERQRIADAIIEAMDEAPARKVALRANYALHDEWSSTINEFLRQDPGVPVDPSDAQYARLRDKAMEVVDQRLPESYSIKPVSLFVASPMYGGQCYGAYADSMMKLSALCFKHSIPFRFFTVFNESHIDRARNVCADEFLKSGFSHMMCIDSDISFKAEDVFELLEWNKEIICGFYPKKRINWKKIVEAVRHGYADKDPEILGHFVGDMVFTPALNDDSMRSRTIYEPTLLHEGGTGFMLVNREVFEKIKAPSYTKNGPGSEHITCYFDAQIEQEPYVRHLSEDFDFCRRAREAGIEIWLAPWIKLTHHGYYQFIGNIEALAAAQRGKAA